MDEQPILESINNKKLSKSAADGHNTIPAWLWRTERLITRYICVYMYLHACTYMCTIYGDWSFSCEILFQRVMQVEHLIHYLCCHQDVSVVCLLGVLRNYRRNSNKCCMNRWTEKKVIQLCGSVKGIVL
jgi:hypothetical protein